MTLSQRTKRELLASQVALKRRQNNEDQLARELGRFFKKLKKSVLKGLDEYWSDYQLLQGQVNLMLSPVHEAHKEYYEIIRKYKLREYQLGKAEAKRLTRLANKDKVALKAVTTLGIQGFVDKDKNSLFGTLPRAEEDLLNRTFRTTENTLNRVDNQLNKIISDGYREGKGINKVANDITQRFDQLASWEARRIARTEINTSHNQATRDQYAADGVEYTQWIAAGDDRTRDSHVDVDGEIIPIDGKYSNGLAFPGDTSGPLEEWINCRCSNAPFVVPYGFMAPSFSPFRESDLVPINQEVAREPTSEQLEQNLSPEQRQQYDKYTRAVEEAQSILDSKFSLPRERLQARTRLEYNLSKLNQLKMVANGELARGYQQVIGTATASTNQQEEPYQLNNREDSFTDIIITQEQFEKVISHQAKRENAKLEFGNSIDNITGRLIHSKDIRGKKNTVKVPRHYNSYSVIHNHTNNGGFSGGDGYSHVTGKLQGVCYATTPSGVWIMRDTNQGAYNKKEGVPDSVAYKLKYKMEGKYKEIVKETKDKYQEAYDNAPTKQEKNRIHRETNEEIFENYNQWLLEEYGVGKRRNNPFEIEFIPKEKLKDVQF